MSESIRIEPHEGRFGSAVVRGEGESRIARLVLTGCAASNTASPVSILKTAAVALRDAGASCRYLVTPAGFISVKADESWPGNVSWKTTEWEKFDRKARGLAADVMSVMPAGIFTAIADELVLGVDVAFTANGKIAPVGQAAIRWDVARGAVLASTGKSYPQSGEEEARLIRNGRANNHVQEGDGLATYVCHDLIAFRNPRKHPQGCRREAHEQLRSTLSGTAKTVLHLAHTADRAGTWTPSWQEIERTIGKSGEWASAFRYRTKGNGTPRRKDEERSRIPLTRKMLRQLATSSVTTVVVSEADSRDLKNLG